MKHTKWAALALVAATSMTAGCATICKTDSRVVETNPIYFDTGSAVIKAKEQSELNGNVATLKAHPGWNVVLEGSADARGSAARNSTLGKERADAVRGALEKAGIHKDRIRTTTIGDRRADAACKHDSCWQADRRVTLKIVD